MCDVMEGVACQSGSIFFTPEVLEGWRGPGHSRLPTEIHQQCWVGIRSQDVAAWLLGPESQSSLPSSGCVPHLPVSRFPSPLSGDEETNLTVWGAGRSEQTTQKAWPR